jgi:hypothetical protein
MKTTNLFLLSGLFLGLLTLASCQKYFACNACHGVSTGKIGID